MPAVLTSYKVELAKRGRKIRDLAEAMNLPYNKVSRVLNGYDIPPIDFDKRTIGVFEQWDKNEAVQSR